MFAYNITPFSFDIRQDVHIEKKKTYKMTTATPTLTERVLLTRRKTVNRGGAAMKGNESEIKKASKQAMLFFFGWVGREVILLSA